MSCPISWLFVPGDRPDRFEKALATTAGAVIFDLEDAVAPSRKTEARSEVTAVLSGTAGAGKILAVRINPLATQAGIEDLAALLRTPHPADILLLPKAEQAAAVALAGAVLGDAKRPTRLLALVESARGLAAAADIAQASPRLAGLMFGAADYAADLGLRATGAEFGHARATLVNAAASGGLYAVDSPDFAIDDIAALEASCARARHLGFHGKAAIHPGQLPMIARAFAPSPEELAEARHILALCDGGARAIGGKMIDIAILRWAHRIIDSAG